MQELIVQLKSIARGMWAFRWPGLVVAWVAAAIGVVMVWRIPDQYEATARIYVNTDSILKPLMSGLAVQPNVEQQINILSRTLISRPNIEKLIRMADLDLKSRSAADQDALIEKLTNNIQIRVAGGINLYSMSYRDAEQDKAKRVVQSLVSIFVETGLGSSRKDTDSAKTFLADQIQTFRLKLEEAEARVKDFQLRNLDLQTADGKDSASLLRETSAAFNQARLELREAEKAREAAKKQLAEERAGGGGSGSGTSLTSSLLEESSIVISTPEIDARIDQQRRNLDQLLQRYTDKHPDIVYTQKALGNLEEQKKKEVAELRRAALARPIAPPSAQPVNAAVQEISRMVAASEVQVASLTARVAEYSARYAAARNSLKTAPQLEAEAARLNRDYGVTKRNYEDLVARRQSAVMSGELDVASGVADFRLIDPPRVTPQPVYPNRPGLLPVVLLAALGAGLAVAFLASQLRPTFSDAEALRAQTGLPLLGVVTLVASDQDRKRKRGSLIRFVSASGGLVGLFVAGIIALMLTSRITG